MIKMNNTTKLLVMDVDGTLTDGKIYVGEQGEIFKAFNVKDGYAIHEILPKYNILPVIITGRVSNIVENRAKELGIIHIYQGVKDKLNLIYELTKKLALSFEDLAYIGDDDNDFEAMKVAALVGCPADASENVLKQADFISSKIGGNGAVREFIEWIVKNKYCN
jgi:3-deoxy-D-manno-octulosonate 8-phosphate phosphatase (KDO 8-P phosphatase)